MVAPISESIFRSASTALVIIFHRVTRLSPARRANVTINFFVGILVATIFLILSSARRCDLYEHFPKSSRTARPAYEPCAVERANDSRDLDVMHGVVLLSHGNGVSIR